MTTATVEASLRSLLGASGLDLVPDDRPLSPVIVQGMRLAGLRSRCRAAVDAAPAGSRVIVVIHAEQQGLQRLARWLILPFQVAIATRALGHPPASVHGRLVVFPDIVARSVTYELRSAAQRYAERLLVSRPPESLPARTLRRALGAWAGCDPSAGAILIIGTKP